MIHTIALFTILVIDHGIVKSVHVSTSLPCGRMHKDSGINTHNIIVHLGHAFPPLVSDILFQLSTPLPVIIYSLQSIVYFATGKYKSVFLTMRYNRLKSVTICCHKVAKISSIRSSLKFAVKNLKDTKNKACRSHFS